MKITSPHCIKGSSTSRPSDTPTAPTKPIAKPYCDKHKDGLTLSNEAHEMAAVDPGACNNNWRCLEQLDLRGLLA